MGKTIALNLSKDYVSHWGVWEACRELLQNAIDQDEMSMSYSCESGTIPKLSITSYGSALDPKTLLMGSSTKTNDKDTIGQYGEGYKLALLVLTRLGYKVTVHTGGEIWSPEFRLHEHLGEECLHIDIIPDYVGLHNAVLIEVEGISECEHKLISSRFIKYTDINHVAEWDGTRAFIEGNPKVYCGGLYVCELSSLWHNSYKYSYDIHPSKIDLDRDRSTACTFTISRVATELFTKCKKWELIADLLSSESGDLCDHEKLPYQDGDDCISIKCQVERAGERAFFKVHGSKSHPIPDNLTAVDSHNYSEDIISQGLTPVKVKPMLYNMMSPRVTKQRVVGSEKPTTLKRLEKLLKVCSDSQELSKEYVVAEIKECIIMEKVKKGLNIDEYM